MAKRMTTAAVSNYRPARKRREIPDAGSPGLYLVVQTSGIKSWALRFRRPDGKSAKLTLGRLDPSGNEMEGEPVIGQLLTLPAARRLATDVMRQRALGRDVVADAKAANRRKRQAHAELAANSFGKAAAAYIAYAKRRGQRRWREAAKFLGLDPDSLEPLAGGLAERWSDKPVAKIDGSDVFQLVDEVRHSGVPGRERRSSGPTEGMARSMHAVLSSMFRWLKERRQQVNANPVASVKKPDPPVARDRVLDDGEIVQLWRATGEIGEPFDSIFKLLLLSGCRLNEIAGMRWDELSADGATLTIPATRTKNKKPHDVMLAPAARDIIAAQPRIGASPFVFTGRTGATAASGFSKAKARLDELMRSVPEWRTHDLRRTVASGLQRLGVPLPVTEKVLGHTSGSFAGIVGIYQRHEYREERRQALERWAAHIEGLVSGRAASVTPIRSRTRS